MSPPTPMVSLAALLLIASTASAEFVVAGPTHDGEEITVDLPTSEHMRNSGGNDRTPQNPSGAPGRGYGLCVFTSGEHAARWANIQTMRGFQKWMENYPGGGDPPKFAAMVSRYCKEKNIPEPAFIQHTGGDVAFLKAALATRRMLCVTYNGRDGKFYSDYIDHMVNLVHLSDKWAVILDNNNPGKYLWMSPAEFLSRWRGHGRGGSGSGGGWGVVFLDDPAAPVPLAPVAGVACPCGGDCGPDCDCGCVCRKRTMFGQCQPNYAPNAVPSFAPTPTFGNASTDIYRIKWLEESAWPGWKKAVVGGYERGWLNPETGEWYDSYTRETIKLKPEVQKPIEQKSGNENYGINTENLPSDNAYTKNGKPVTRREAFQLVTGGGVDNDNNQPWIVAVGDAAFLSKFRSLWQSLPSETRSKFNLQTYTPDNWGASGVGYASGVTCTKPDNGSGKAVVQWRFRELPSIEQLTEGLRKADPNYRPDADPDPAKPKPKTPSGPDGNPINPQTPTIPIMWVIVGIGIVILLIRKDK
jgi:hypothetical protein